MTAHEIELSSDPLAKLDIHITPEMVAAGASIIRARDDIDLGHTGCEILAEAILRAAVGTMSQSREDASKDVR